MRAKSGEEGEVKEGKENVKWIIEERKIVEKEEDEYRGGGGGMN